MSTQVKYRRAVIRKTPTDGRGTFNFTIESNPRLGDRDNERIAGWVNLPGEVPLVYSHAAIPMGDSRAGGDPGAIIGTVKIESAEDGWLIGSGQLDLDNPLAMGVYERMLRPDDDPLTLRELSVGFEHVPSKRYLDDNLVWVIPEATLLEISVVFRGSQPTWMTDVKSRANAHNEHSEDPLVRAAHKFADESDAESQRVLARKKTRDPEIVEYERQLNEITPRRITQRDRETAVRLGGTDPEIVRFRQIFDQMESGQPGKVMSGDIVEEFLAGERRLRELERAEAKRLADLGRAVGVFRLLPSEEEVQADVAEEHCRFVREMEERDEEKRIERERLEQIDAQRREWTRNDPNTLTP